MISRIIRIAPVVLFATALHAFEEIEPNEESQANDVLLEQVITGTLPVHPTSERDTFRIRIEQSTPVSVVAIASVTSGDNPAAEFISLRAFSASGKESFSSGAGTTAVALGMTNLPFSPSDLFLQVRSSFGNQGERYEIRFSVTSLDKGRPKISFGRAPNRNVEKFLAQGTRSVNYQVFDVYGLQQVFVRAEGETYREVKVTRPLLPPRMEFRTRFRFRQLRDRETVYVKAIDLSGNVAIKSNRYVRLERRLPPDSLKTDGRL